MLISAVYRIHAKGLAEMLAEMLAKDKFGDAAASLSCHHLISV